MGRITSPFSYRLDYPGPLSHCPTSTKQPFFFPNELLLPNFTKFRAEYKTNSQLQSLLKKKKDGLRDESVHAVHLPDCGGYRARSGVRIRNLQGRVSQAKGSVSCVRSEWHPLRETALHQLRSFSSFIPLG
ncbi:hypothetical protein QQ045_007519 [Rhodiola kirilowii]